MGTRESIGDVYKIRHIQDPLWSKPTILEPGDQLEITLGLPASVSDIEIVLRSPFERRGLNDVAEITETADTLRRLTAPIPTDLDAGLYDIIVSWSGGTDVMPSAAVLVDPMPSTFQVVHMGDPHVSAALSDCPGRNLATVVRQINLLNPDFVLLTGDLISRYGPDEETLSAAQTERDMMHAEQLLQELRVPLFISAGNHDLAYPWLRHTYRDLIARPLEGDHLNYCFNYGNIAFVTYEAFRYYDDFPPGPSRMSLSESQRTWLKRKLEKAEDAEARVLFHHYDYGDELQPIFDQYDVTVALGGHTSGLTEEFVGTTPTLSILEKPVFDGGHFRLLEFSDGSLVRRPYFNHDGVAGGKPIDISMTRANDGTHDENDAVLTNRTDHGFADLRVQFLMRPGHYDVTNAASVKQTDATRAPVLCDVRLDLPARQSRTVHIEPVG